MDKDELINKMVKIINNGTAPFSTKNQIGMIVRIDKKVNPPIEVRFRNRIEGFREWNYHIEDLKLLENMEMESNNMCEYCCIEGGKAIKVRNTYSRHTDAYIGIGVYINEEGNLMVEGCGEVGYPSKDTTWIEEEIPINYCPMCR